LQKIIDSDLIGWRHTLCVAVGIQELQGVEIPERTKNLTACHPVSFWIEFLINIRTSNFRHGFLIVCAYPTIVFIESQEVFARNW
jgi:hypothetical protein